MTAASTLTPLYEAYNAYGERRRREEAEREREAAEGGAEKKKDGRPPCDIPVPPALRAGAGPYNPRNVAEIPRFVYSWGMVNIAFTGGGTGGHIYPGLAVAARLKEMGDFRIFWIGSSAGMDRSIVERAGLEFHGVPSGRLRRYFSLKTIPDMFRIPAGFFAARSLLKKRRPALLFSKGGFVSVPPCAAAASLGIPVFTHESDFSPGLATRLNLRFVARTGGRIFTAYPEMASFLPPPYRGLVSVSGNPVRPEFRNADPAGGRAFLGLGEGDRILLVLGGSQGARELNRLVREVLPELTKLFVVVHQTGPGNEGDPPAERYRPYPYFGEEMPRVLAAADLVFCRSGAGTVYENAVLGRPMILAPLRGSGTRGDQVENARFFEKAGAALVLPGEPKAEDLLEAVAALAADRDRLAGMAAAAARLGENDGALFIARAIGAAAGGSPDGTADGSPGGTAAKTPAGRSGGQA